MNPVGPLELISAMLLDAMTLRDGGTTSVVVEKPEVGQVTYARCK
jgi:hypothetical protein